MTLDATALKRGAALVVGALVAALFAAAPASAATFTNSSPITITADAGNASPYPSSIDLTGLGGIVTDVDVTLHDAFHQQFQDFDIVLVSPSGRRVLLASDTCAGEVSGSIILDDDVGALPASAPCPSGRYAPADYEPEGDFDDGDPAPDGSGLQDLANENPNGTWRLYVYDDKEWPADDGKINGGWSLEIATRSGGAVSFAVGSVTAGEGTTVAVDVVRGGASPLYAGSVTVATTSGTAEAGRDFTPMSQIVSFAPGETRKTVQVEVLADGPFEPEQGFSLLIGAPEGDATVGTPGAVGITIPRDAQQPGPDFPRGDQVPPPQRPFNRRNTLAVAPSVRRCYRAGETLRFRPRMPRGVAIVRSEVFVNGRKVEDNVGAAAIAPIVLTMQGRRMRVRIRLTSHDKRVVNIRRTFRRCKQQQRRPR